MCTVSCGSGRQAITRACDNPQPLNGGDPCDGETTHRRTCSDKACPGKHHISLPVHVAFEWDTYISLT